MIRLLALALAAALAVGPACARPSPLPAGPLCQDLVHEHARYTVCVVDLDRYELKLFLDNPRGEKLGSLANLRRTPDGARLVMAMNAGMYRPDLEPAGLYVAAGRERAPANTAGGYGNFHLKPNGVFYVAGGQAGILETGAYLKRRPKASLATQSGPMLVIDGKLHPRFSEDGESRKVRNGVGIRDARTAIFAISDEAVSFGAFARLFRDELGCRDALYFDGSVSGLLAPNLGRADLGFRPLGPMIGAIPLGGAAAGTRP